jgi:hypothetical protein
MKALFIGGPWDHKMKLIHPITSHLRIVEVPEHNYLPDERKEYVEHEYVAQVLEYGEVSYYLYIHSSLVNENPVGILINHYTQCNATG